MSDRLRIALLTGCLFVIGLHLQQSGRLLLEVWRGPYASERDGSSGALTSAEGARADGAEAWIASLPGPVR